MSDSKGYIITLKDTCADSEASSIKSKITELGGKITNEFSLIKGFSAQLPLSMLKLYLKILLVLPILKKMVKFVHNKRI